MAMHPNNLNKDGFLKKGEPTIEVVGEPPKPRKKVKTLIKAKRPANMDMAMMDGIKREYEAAKQLNSQYRSLHQEICRYFLPSASNYNVRDETEGDNKYGKLFDGTAHQNVSKAATAIMERVFPRGTRWFNFELAKSFRNSPEVPEDLKIQTVAALDMECEKVMRMLDRSNFRRAMRGCAKEWVALGFCAAYIRSHSGVLEEGIPPSLHFETLQNGTYYLSPAPAADRVSVFWERKWTVGGWKRTMPHIPLPDKFGDAMSEQEIWVVEGVRPYQDYGYQYVVFLADTYELIHAEDIVHSPIIVARMEAAAGETYPTGFGAEALPEAQSLNVMSYNHLRLLNLITNPPFAVTAGIEAEAVSIEPGARLVVNNNIGSRNPDIGQIPIANTVGTSLQGLEERREMIRGSMNLMPPLPVEKHNTTATEILKASEQERQSMSAYTDDYIEELVLPMLRTVFQETKKLGVSNETLSDGSMEYQLMIIGDSEKSEKLHDMTRMQAALELALMFKQIPGLPAVYSTEKFFRKVADSTQTTDLLASNAEKMEYYDAQAQIRQQAIQQGQVPQQ